MYLGGIYKFIYEGGGLNFFGESWVSCLHSHRFLLLYCCFEERENKGKIFFGRLFDEDIIDF